MLIYGITRTDPRKLATLDDGVIYHLDHQARSDGVHYSDNFNSFAAQLIGMHSNAMSNMGDVENPDGFWAPVVDTVPLISKWLNLDIIYQGWEGSEIIVSQGTLILAANPAVTDAIFTEIQPYWEQNLVYSYIAQTYLTDDEIQRQTYKTIETTYWHYGKEEWVTIDMEVVDSSEGVAKDYYENGAADVQDELSPYFDQPDVQAAFAESALFLSLTQDQRFAYSSMSRADQYNMLFEDTADYDQYMQDNHAFNLLNMSMIQVQTQQYRDIDLTAIGGQLADRGIDGYSWFRAEFEAETTVIRYDAVSDVLDPIVRLYYGVLGRAPEKDGIEWWVNTFNTDDSKVIEQMAADFAWSQEFLGVDPEQGPTAEQLVTAMYENVLGRAPDDEGYEWWMEKAELAFEHDLRAGTVPGTSETHWISPDDEDVFTFGRIVTGFTESPEYIEGSMADVYASGIALWGPSYEDLIEIGPDLGFTAQELVGVETTHEDYFLI